MVETEETLKFKRYCAQLEKYGQEETVHSPVMAMLRRKARRQLIELMKHNLECTSYINRLWIVGYYHPFHFYVLDAADTMETTTLLTMFCGELQEMLSLSDSKYHSIWNLYIGDLHRYMPDGEIQKTLTSGFYSRAIELDRRHGRAFHMLAMCQESVPEKLRLMILAQLAEIPHKKSSELMEFLKEAENKISEEMGKFMIRVVKWILNDSAKRVDHQMTGLKWIKEFEEKLKDCDYSLMMMMSVLRLAAKLAYKNDGFTQFINGFDVITTFFLEILEGNKMTEGILPEAVSWISDVGEIFESVDPLKNEPHFKSLSVFIKAKWNEINDLLVTCINKLPAIEIVASPPPRETFFLIHGPQEHASLEILGFLINNLINSNHPTMELDPKSENLLRRVNQSVQKPINFPIEAVKDLQLADREDWRPVYVLMDFETVTEKIKIARKIWEIDDFISILPSNVLDKLDLEKSKNQNVRPVIRSLMELQAKGKMILKQCSDERNCAEQLVQSAKGSDQDHQHIVAFLCQKPERAEPMKGVTFYRIQDFYKKYLE